MLLHADIAVYEYINEEASFPQKTAEKRNEAASEEGAVLCKNPDYVNTQQSTLCYVSTSNYYYKAYNFIIITTES